MTTQASKFIGKWRAAGWYMGSEFVWVGLVRPGVLEARQDQPGKGSCRYCDRGLPNNSSQLDICFQVIDVDKRVNSRGSMKSKDCLTEKQIFPLLETSVKELHGTQPPSSPLSCISSTIYF